MYDSLRIHQALESRSLGGYFQRVISVHPLAFLHDHKSESIGAPNISILDPTNIFINGRYGAFKLFRWIPSLNFLFAQIQLVLILYKFAKQFEVKVVRIGDPYYLGILGIILAKLLRVPLVIRVCANYDEFVKVSGKPMMPRLLKFRKVEKLIERFVFPRCNLIAGANEDNLRYALENGGKESHTTVFRYGNLIHHSHWRHPKDRPSAESILEDIGVRGETFLMTVARLEPMKRIDHIVRVTSRLHTCGRPVYSLIIGDGSQRRELEQLAEELRMSAYILFLGQRSQDWISTVLPRASVIASPHMGRALTEAALSAVPIVAYDFDWQREIVVSGETGYLVRDGDWQEMASKIHFLIDNPFVAKSMGSAARDRAEAMMDPAALELHEREEYTKLFLRFGCET